MWSTVSINQNLPRSFLLFATTLIVLVIVVVAVERATWPTSVVPSDDRDASSDLSRAMTFVPPPEPKR